LALNPAMLAFTICQVPVVVQLGKENKVLVTLQAGGEIETEGLEIEAALSKSIFNRDGTVAKVEVRIASHAQ
ncbi:MAG: hypothetical protein KDI38_16460, partial [Calditrichaeota bacterium]|nr:hypothetical protein [Calditrichota bacterium]